MAFPGRGKPHRSGSPVRSAAAWRIYTNRLPHVIAGVPVCPKTFHIPCHAAPRFNALLATLQKLPQLGGGALSRSACTLSPTHLCRNLACIPNENPGPLAPSVLLKECWFCQGLRETACACRIRPGRCSCTAEKKKTFFSRSVQVQIALMLFTLHGRVRQNPCEERSPIMRLNRQTWSHTCPLPGFNRGNHGNPQPVPLATILQASEELLFKEVVRGST